MPNASIARISLMAGISASALLIGTAAFAQAGSTVQPVPIADQGDVEGNAIIVTARRSDERLQDVPIVVSVLGAQDLQRQRLDNLSDIARKTPGFNFENFTGPLAQPVIRGQTNLRTTSPVQNVATNLNGVYIQRGYFVDQSLLDLERVEIIKGPQSALYGRNAFAGVISLITRQPNVDTLSGRISGTVGSDKLREIKGGVNVPIVPGVFAIYAGGGYSKFDGTWTNNHPLANAGGFTNGKLGGYEKRAYQLGAQLRAGPVTFDGMYVRTEREIEQNPAYTLSTFGLTNSFNTLNGSPKGTGGVLVTGPSASAALLQNRLYIGKLPTNVVLAPGETRLPGLVVDPRAYGLRGPSEIWMGSAKLDTGGPITLAYLYGHTQANIVARGSSQRDPLTPVVVFGSNYGNIFDASGTGSTFKSDSHEGKATFDFGGTVTGFTGVNFTRTSDIDSNASEFAPVNSLVEPAAGIIFPVAPGNAVFPATATPPFTPYPPLFTRTTYFQRVENVFAVFGSVQWKPTPKIAISLEGRYTEEDQRGRDLIARDIGGLGSGFLAQVPPTVARSSKFFTPRGSVTYKFDDSHNVYATVARGYKSGGFNGVAADYNRTTTIVTPGQPTQIFVDQLRSGTAIPAVRVAPAGSTATVAFVQVSPGTAGLSALQQTYQAETNVTYEIGSKNRFFNGALTLNVGAYLTEWKNVQSNSVRLLADATAPTSFAAIVPSVTGNVGDVRVYGAEVSGNFRITRELRLDFGASYNHARYKNGVVSQRIGASGNCDGIVCSTITVPGIAFPVVPIGGNQLERTPEFDGLAGLTYDTKFNNGMGFFARADVTYQTKQFVDETNLAFVPSRTLVNASTGIRIGKFEVQAFVKNLFDKEYVTSSLFLVGIAGAGSASYVPILGDKRSGGVTASFNF